jgi:hypothetical protein
MNKEEFKEYLSNPDNYKILDVAFDVGERHVGVETIKKEFRMFGRTNDADAMQFMMDNDLTMLSLHPYL